MGTNLLHSVRRRVIVLTIAGLLALSATCAPVLLDGLTGSSTVDAVMACQNQGGGCG